ncbi:DNA polymerase III subunit [bacterium]|nr:DNA polymerase III subunit [candidate division CSSED10-310 bacterium]
MIYGNLQVQDLLHRAVDNGRLHHALLFHGPEGVGKYTLAIELIRRLNCRTPGPEPCGSCHPCRRLMPPFVFHPDLQVFRELGTRLFLHRERLFSQFTMDQDTPAPGLHDAFIADYENCLAMLHSQGVFEQYYICRMTRPAMDVLRFSRDAAIKPSLLEKLQASPAGAWLFKKIQQYRETIGYDRTIRIDAMRDMQKRLYLHPLESTIKTVILDDADTMLVPAQNSLLKILEEPPGNALIILIVRNPSGLLPTIRSRCQPIPFSKLSHPDMTDALLGSFDCAPDDLTPLIDRSDGSIARFLSTDWELENQRRHVFSSLFHAPDDHPAGWVLRVTQTLMETSDGKDDDLDRFYHWLHDMICSSPGSEALDGVLPGNRPLTVPMAVNLLDGITWIKKQSVFHTDVQLNIESMLFRMLSGEEFVTR